jgi:hypothetical protein
MLFDIWIESKERLSILYNQRDIRHMDLHREGAVRERVNVKHELFFVPLGILFCRFALDMAPESEATFVEQVSSPVERPFLNFCVQRAFPQKPFVPQEKSKVRSFDSA